MLLPEIKQTFTIKGQSIIIGLISLLIISGCQDDPADFGKDILPGKSFINAHSYDKHYLTTYSVTKDSVRTDDPAFGILGYLKDPDFGISDADLLTQVGPGAIILDSAFNMGSDYFADSLVLTLNYRFNWWYGDMLAKHMIKVYELTTDIYPTPNKYYSNLNVDGYYDPNNPVAERLSFVNDDVNDTLWIRSANDMWEYPDSLWRYPSYLWNTSLSNLESHNWSFLLNDELTQRIFNLDSTTLANPAQFKQILKGFYISSDLIDEGDMGSLVKMDMLGAGTDLKLYYSHYSRDEDGVVTDTLKKSHIFPINVEAVRINRFMHDFENKIDFNDPDASKLFVQGMAGSYARIDFPEDLYNWADSLNYEESPGNTSHIGFSVVDIFIHVDTIASDLDRYFPPSQLTIYAPKKDEDGNYLDDNNNTVDKSQQVLYRPYFLDKYGQLQFAFSEGTFDPNLKLYYFNLKVEFLDFIMKRKEEAGIEFLKEVYLAPANPDGNFQRVILHSSESETDPVTFNIGYVKYY